MALTRLQGDQNLRVALPPMRLHLDDVQDVYDLLAELGDVVLGADMHSASSPADLAELPRDQIDSLYLGVPARSVAVTITRKKLAQITAENPTAEVRGILGLVERLLRSRRRPFVRQLVRPGVPFALFVLAEAPVAAGMLGVDKSYTNNAYVAVVAMTAAALFMVRVAYLDDRRTRMIARRRRDAPNFWRRKKDDVALSLISLVVGLIAGLLIQ